MLDDLNRSVEVVTMWLDQLPTLAAQFSIFIMCPATLGLMTGQALWCFLFVCGLVAKGAA